MWGAGYDYTTYSKNFLLARFISKIKYKGKISYFLIFPLYFSEFPLYILGAMCYGCVIDRNKSG